MTILLIDGVDFSKITKYKQGHKKLWGNDTGRNLAGKKQGSLVGIFTKLEVTTGELNATQAQALINAVDVEEATVTYFDTKTGTTKSESFYFGDLDLEAILINEDKEIYKPVSFSIIGNNPR